MPPRLGLVSRLDSDASKFAQHILSFLRRKRIRALLEQNLAEKIGLQDGRPLREMRADAIITVGGDGTVLRTHLEIPRPETPLIAVNMGRRGYLSEIRPRNALHAIQRYIHGDYTLEDHMKLSVSFDGEHFHDALNEGLVCGSKPAKMLSFQVSVSGETLIRRWADGLIVATPTGSTAHAYSAGGPILKGDVSALAIVFQSPLREPRSLVVPSKTPVDVRVLEYKSRPKLIVDGNLEREVSPSETVRFIESKHRARFVRFSSLFLEKSIERLASLERIID